jgi:hypothetical protein
MNHLLSESVDAPEILGLRPSLRPPIPEIAIAARLLRNAVTAHIEGRFGEAENLLDQANIDAINEWADSLIGKLCEYNTPRFRLSPSAKGSIQREKTRMPSSELKRMLHIRDGYHCRFCGTPILRRQVRKRLVELYPKAVHGNGVRHAAVFVMEVQYDHIVPHSKGGRNELENLVLTCLPCNYGRGGFTLEEMGLSDPRTHQHVECIASGWDGLEQLLQ